MTDKPPTDRRIAKTKQAIQSALVALIKEKGFEALTVNDIVTRANLNRGTFYLHYQDKFDLLEQVETEVLQEVQAIFLRANPLHLGESPKADQLTSVIILLLEYVKAHAALMQAFFGLQGKLSFVARLRTLAEQNLKIGALTGLDPKQFTVPQEYLLSYVFHANLGVLQAWFATGCQETPQEVARILFRLSFEGPMAAAGLVASKA